MSRSIFGWDLPPGCSAGDPHINPPPCVTELFEEAVNDGRVTLEEEEANAFESMAILVGGYELLEKLAAWASDMGSEEARSDDAQWWDLYFLPRLEELAIPEAIIRQIESVKKGG